MSEKTPYKLSATLLGHSGDVRSLSASSNALFSSSRDGTARSWLPAEQGADARWKEGATYAGQHEGFVNAVKWIPSSSGGSGSLATGGQDALIHLTPLDEANGGPSHTLIGHTSNVCTLDASEDGKYLVSGSWDKTAKVWSLETFSEIATLQGHAQAVWTVLWISPTQVLTGAADNFVRLWEGNKCVKTFKGHTQAVRALAKVGQTSGAADLFASAGNDGSIRIWSLSSGEAVHTLAGHDSFVYTLSWIPDSLGGGLVSGGEDRTVRVWKASDGSLEQTITVPAISVWTVTTLPNGDIAAGSSDNIVRVFTREESRASGPDELAAFEEQVSRTTLNSSQVGDVKKTDLPGPEALLQDGRKEGQVIMVKSSAGIVEAHQWSSASRAWQKIGEVVDAVGSSRKQLYNGVEYDYVFDVDIAEGQPPLKLPYNANQNPYEAAQRFLQRTELPPGYIDEVVRFIEKNTSGVQIGAGSQEYVDPYTGASRYRAAGSSGGASGSGGAQPFGGDPFTGGGRASTASTSAKKLLPHRTFLTFTQANLAALRTKLGQLNDQLAQDQSTASSALSSDELTGLDSALAYVVAAQASPGSSRQPPLGTSETAVVVKLVSWPYAHRFPGLDFLRILSLYSPPAESLPILLDTIRQTSAPPKEQETNTMLAFRALANSISSASGKQVAKENIEDILHTLTRRGLLNVNKNGKVALSTIALNYSVLTVQKDLKTGGKALLELIADLLRDADGEVVYRSLIALGNILSSSQLIADIPAAGLQRYKNLAKDAASRLPEARIKEVVAELTA